MINSLFCKHQTNNIYTILSLYPTRQGTGGAKLEIITEFYHLMCWILVLEHFGFALKDAGFLHFQYIKLGFGF